MYAPWRPKGFLQFEIITYVRFWRLKSNVFKFKIILWRVCSLGNIQNGIFLREESLGVMCTHWTCGNLTALVCYQPCWWSSTSDFIISGGEKSMVRWKSTHFVSFKHLSIICYFRDRNSPANTRRLPNVGSTLARRLRRRSNNKPTSGIHLMFDEFAYLGCAVSSCLYSTVELCMQQLFRVWLSQIVLALFDGIWEIDIICM